jgi:hypothetical protein
MYVSKEFTPEFNVKTAKYEVTMSITRKNREIPAEYRYPPGSR